MKKYIVPGIITAIVASTLIGNAYSALTMSPCDKLKEQSLTDTMKNQRDLNSNNPMVRIAAESTIRVQHAEYTQKAAELGCD